MATYEETLKKAGVAEGAPVETDASFTETLDKTELFSPIAAETIQPSETIQPDDPRYFLSRQREQDVRAQQELFRQSFDVGELGLRGATDQQVLNYILKTYPSLGGYEQNVKDYQTARSRGASDPEIIAQLTRAQAVGPYGALGQEVAKGVTEMGPVAAGGYMGFQIGTLGGPFAWLTIPIATGAGLASGYLFGDALSDLIYSDAPYAPSVRPYGEAGYSLGSGAALSTLGPVSGALSYARNIAAMNGRNVLNQFKPTMVERIQRSAIERPGAYLRTEAAGIGGGAYGAFLAEKKHPGDALWRMGAEAGLGALSPVAVADGALGFAKNQLVSVYKTFSPEGRMSKQGQAFYDFIVKNGEDPKALLKALDEQDSLEKLAAEMGVKLDPRTTAGVTRSPAMLLLQNTLAQDKAYGPTVRNAIKRDYEGMSNLVEIMTKSGDPVLISKAAELRKQLMEGMIIQRLDDINAATVRLNRNVSPKDPDAAMKAGKTIEDLTDKGISELRDVEKTFYDAVDGKELIEIPNLLDTYRKIEDEITELKIPLPYSVRRLVFKSQGESVEVAEANAEKISRFNSRIDKARDAISDINASYPDSVAAAEARISKDVPLEQQLSEVQEALRALGAEDALTKLGIKAPERNRQIAVLQNKAQELNGILSVNDLKAQKALPQEGESVEITLGEVMRARSQLLTQARQASANNNFQEAHFLSDLADSIVDDFGIKASREDLSPNQQALQEAFAFSKSIGDVFSRAFPNVVLGKNKTGARRIMPELLSKVTFSGGGDATAVKYNQLENAMAFVADSIGAQMDDTLTGTVGTLRGAQEDLMRAAFEKLVDKTTGRVSEESLNKFKFEYRNALFDANGNSRFPDFTADLENVASAENMLETRLRLTGDPRFNRPGASLKLDVDGRPVGLGDRAPSGLMQRALESEISFYNSIGADSNPNKLMGATIGSPDARPKNAMKGFRTLIRNTKAAENRPDVVSPSGKVTSFRGATEGLRNMVLDRAYTYASGLNEAGEHTVNFVKFNQFLNQPIAKGQPSVLEIMRQEGVVDGDFALRLNTLMDEGAKTQAALASAKSGDAATTKLPKPMLNKGYDTLVYLIGLRLGRAATQAAPGTGQGLAEPGIFGREIVDVFVDIPATKQQDLLLQAAMDPKFFKELMERAEPGTAKYVARNARLRAYLVNAGFIGATAEERYNQERLQRREGQRRFSPMPMDPRTLRQTNTVEPIIGDQSSVRPEQNNLPSQPAAPTTSVASAAPVQPRPITPPPAARGPVDRSRYAAMFPTDIASGLIRQGQGIGSLMG